MGVLRPTDRRLRGANGSPIAILGCSSCMVSFLGLRTEFPVLVCDLSTDAIIGTDTLGSILPHTLDIKKGLLSTEGGVSLQLHRRDAALSGRVFTVGQCSIPPCSEAVLHCTTRTVGGRSFSLSGLLEGLTVFAENTGLVVGRTLVDPSGWRVPVLVSNFSQETVMVEPFSEVGMIAQVSAIQLVMDKPLHASYDPSMLPYHLHDMLNLTSEFAENTGLVVGRTLVDPSGWRVPVLVSNFSQETVMVEPFSEVGMIAQVSPIQLVMDKPLHASYDPSMLPYHLHDMLNLTSENLDNVQRGQLANTLLQFTDLFPVPGSALTGHTDAVEHSIDTGTTTPIRCAPRRMSPQKIKKEETCVTEMLTGGQIEPSDSPWSAPVVLVTKKDSGTRFCVDYRRLNLATVKDAYPLPRIDDTLDMLAGKRWFSTLDLASGYWQVSLPPEARCKTAFATHSGLFQFRVMPFGLCNAPCNIRATDGSSFAGITLVPLPGVP